MENILTPLITRLEHVHVCKQFFQICQIKQAFRNVRTIPSHSFSISAFSSLKLITYTDFRELQGDRIILAPEV